MEALRLLILNSGQTSVQDVSAVDFLKLFQTLGFDSQKLQTIEARLPSLCQKLFAPLCEDRLWSPDEWRVSENLEKILGPDKWWFRTAGPPWFFLLMRTVGAVTSAIHRLSVPIHVAEIFRSIVGNEAYRKGERVMTENSPQIPDGMAQSLCVSVKEKGEMIAEIKMPVKSVDQLESLIPSDSVQKIIEQGVDLSVIKSTVQKSGYVPQILFEAQVGSKVYKVWLS
jgi:hypothetical protein